MPGHDIIAIGASAGGVEALPKLLKGIPKSFPGSIFVVVHIPGTSESFLPQILSRAGELPAVHPGDKERIEKGKIYVAPPDHHLWIEDRHVRVTHGPKVNRHRPAVDPLLESAGYAYGTRAVGVILTGYQDDGAAGLHALKKCGGKAVVQDPADAMVPSMPESALRYVDPDYCLPLRKIQPVLLELVRKRVEKVKVLCSDKRKFKIEAPSMNPVEMTARLGPPSAFICPDCNGPIWELREGKTVKYRCMVGHQFSPQSFLDGETDAVERALWVAVKTLEERSALLRSMVKASGNRLNANWNKKAQEAENEANVIRKMIKKKGY